MSSRINKMKENVIKKSKEEKWTDKDREGYLKKVFSRVQLYKSLLKNRKNKDDILSRYLNDKIIELTSIHYFLEKKWKK